MKFLLHASMVFLLCLTLPTSALADDDPDSGFYKLIGRYIEEARSNYGSTNGLLASDLLLLLDHDLRPNVVHHREREVIANVKELLDVYPKVPSENQRYLAFAAIDLGYKLIDGKSLNEELHPHIGGRHFVSDTPAVTTPPPFVDPISGGNIIACVVEAAAKNHWTPVTQSGHVTWFGISLSEALAKVAADNRIDPVVRSQAQYALTSQAVSQAPLVEPIVADLEALLKADWPPKQKQEKAVNWARYQLSWSKDKPEQPADTPPEKRQATYCKSITTYTFPAVESLKIRHDLSALIELYPTLSEADQYAFCARIMDLTYKSISTDVHKQADTLFWEIFSSVRIGWLDSDYNEAKKQLQIVTQLNEKMYADGLSDLAFYTMTKEAVEERLTGMHCSR